MKGHMEHCKLGAARSNNPMNLVSIPDCKVWIFVLCQKSTEPVPYLGLFSACGHFWNVSLQKVTSLWMLFKGKKVLCREQLFFLARARGSLNPPASCLLIFPIKVAEADAKQEMRGIERRDHENERDNYWEIRVWLCSVLLQ